MNTVSLGIIGAGRIGKLHTENLMRMSDVVVEMIYDPFLDSAWAESHELRVVRKMEDIFSSNTINGVLIFSPSNFHADQIIQAARAGKHIFCEKPIALDPAEINTVLDTVRENNVKLQLGFNRRFDPDFKRLKDIVVQGEIGQLYMIRITARDPSPPPPEYIRSSGGIFLDMTIHDFDMVRYLSDSEVVEVYARGAVLVDPVFKEAGDIDTAITIMSLKNGALAVIDNSRQAVYGYDQRIEVFGSKGSIVAENNTETQTVLTTAKGVESDRPLDFFLKRYQTSYRAEMRAFIRALKTGADPLVTGEDGLKSILIGLAAGQSLKENRPITVES
ncbi:MAG: inositol 2-dehydrogenase [Candidatus Marinimicrobia bacterium]|nr:inositol 2-dehydrogenase [Candidatus Neomarinimicrobiota bacterium]MCH7763433.1 inositol 2-dehydrogenase [Candidatus Neomarinimicrobiota bacterium]